jgi:hypothetical protein
VTDLGARRTHHSSAYPAAIASSSSSSIYRITALLFKQSGVIHVMTAQSVAPKENDYEDLYD